MCALIAACGGDDALADAAVDATDADAYDVSVAADADGDSAPMPPEPGCGDRILQHRESCDDGNETSGDGCSDDCRFESECGDGRVDGAKDEVCDDGNLGTHDECRGDCRAERPCELCAPSSGCGDGMLGSGEVCDDGNDVAWDGCDPTCHRELVLVMETITAGEDDDTCDFTGDGTPDYALRDVFHGLGTLLLELASTELRGPNLLAMIGPGYERSSEREAFAWAAVEAESADADPESTFGGDGHIRLQGYDLVDGRYPARTLVATRTGARIDAGPGPLRTTLTVWGAIAELDWERARLRVTLDAIDDPRRAHVSMCAAMPIVQLAEELNLLTLLPAGGAPSCNQEVEPRLADVVAGGGVVFGGGRIAKADLDVDIDRDGLEALVIDAEGSPGCQPVIVACVDGDGTRIDGGECVFDPRIADGYSTAFQVEAVRVTSVGVVP